MKKLVQSTKKLSLKSTKKSKKKKGELTPIAPVSPVISPKKLLEEDFDDTKDNYNDEFDDVWTPQSTPKDGWTTKSGWSAKGLKSLDSFLEHYSSIGIAGIREEFRKKVNEFKTSKYGDSAFKANPTKNRDNDIMACLDGSRVELEDKGYINASWVFDKARLETKYILTQEPMRSTIGDFWQMVYQYRVNYIVVFYEKEEGWPPKNLPNNLPDCATIMDKFWPIKKTNGIIVDNLCVKRLNEKDKSHFYTYDHWFYGSPQKPILETRSLKCKVVKKHSHNEEEKKFGCNSTKHETFLFFVGKSKWGAGMLNSILRDIAIIGGHGWGDGPLVLMDDFSGTSQAAVFTVVDIMGSLLYRGEKNLTLPQVVKWVRSCRNGAIRTEDDYVFIVEAIFLCTMDVYEEGHKNDEEKREKRTDKYVNQYEKLFGGGEKEK